MHDSLIKNDTLSRTRALDPTQSFIVQAPAGSGKTEILIQRFLTLLTIVKMPEEILAITFTKKSANEMRARVIKALKQALSDKEPTSPHAKKTWSLATRVLERDKSLQWNLIQNPNTLRIQTIDSLCSYLTKQLPLLSLFGSAPDISDQPNFLYSEAVSEVLSHIEEKLPWSPAIAKLLIHLDNDLNKLHDLLVSLLKKRDQWLPYIHFNDSDQAIKKQLEHHLTLVISDALTSLKVSFPKQHILALTEILHYTSRHNHQSVKSDECGLPGTHASDKDAWMKIAKLLLTKSFAWRKRVDESIGFPALKSITNPQEKDCHIAYRANYSHLIEALSQHEDLRLALVDLFFLPEPTYQKNQWEILQSLLQVLKVVAAQLRVTFEQHSQIDFIENAQAALTALGDEENPTDLVLALDYRIQHILVDEFQDTSFTQYHLLEKLTLGWEPGDGRSLFIVGDPMQSIYRFREAEVGLFIRMLKEGLGKIQLTPLTLSVNFRSSRHIVDWNNLHFQHIFPTFNDIATGAVSFSTSVAYHHDENHELFNSSVYIKGLQNGNDEMQALAIVDSIKVIKEKQPTDTIAILVRSRSHLASIILALKSANLPYRAVDIDPLSSRQCILDILSLTCAMLHPADRIAWLSILRAPWCGLTLADLEILAQDNSRHTIWENLQCNDVVTQLSYEGRARLKRVMKILNAKIAQREREDLRYWVESTWMLLGGPATLQDESEIDDISAFFKLLEAIEQQHPVLNIDKLKEKINQLYAPALRDETAIQIMTIHTAKGLEFDTVILPHLERKITGDDRTLLSWMERPLNNDQIALLLAPIHATGNDKDTIFEYIHRQQKLKIAYETDRLFYVACTRARKSLYLFFNLDENLMAESKIPPGSFLYKLWPLLDKKNLQPTTHMIEKSDADGVSPRLIARLEASWKNPMHDIVATQSAYHLQQNGFQLPNTLPQKIGIVTHAILKELSERKQLWWIHSNASIKNMYIQSQLKQLGTLPQQLNEAALLVLRMIENSLCDARGRWLLQAHDQAQSEFSITAIVQDKPERLVIDRTFVDSAGIRWIIDYKTTLLSQSDVEAFLEKEQEKYRVKMAAYATAFSLFEDAYPIRLGLYFPAIPAWKEWDE